MEKEQLKQARDKAEALAALNQTPGGQVLLDVTRETVMATVHLLSSQYADKTEQEIRSLCATLRANLEIYNLLSKAESEMEALEEILRAEPTS